MFEFVSPVVIVSDTCC